MQVAQLGHRVAKRVVDRALGELAAVDVRHGDAERQCSHGRRVHLEAVAEHDHDVRAAGGRSACANPMTPRPIDLAVPSASSDDTRHLDAIVDR